MERTCVDPLTTEGLGHEVELAHEEVDLVHLGILLEEVLLHPHIYSL